MEGRINGGTQPAPRQIMAALVACILAGAVPVLQPLLLGELARQGHIAPLAIGRAASCETLGMALTTLLSALLFTRAPLRAIGSAAALVGALANVATIMAEGEGILATRFVAGMASGLLIWMFWAVVAESRAAPRLTAIYVIAQSSLTATLGLGFSVVVAPRFGAQAGYAVLAVLNLLAGAGLLLQGPRRLRGAEHTGLPLPSFTGLLGLIVVALHLGGIMALWVYARPVAALGGVRTDVASVALSLAILGQIIGGLLSFPLAAKSRPTVILWCAIVATIAAMAVMSLGGLATFAVSAGIISILWLFSPPFQIGLLMELDRSGRSAAFTGTAQLLGVSIGPSLSALVIAAHGPVGAQFVGITMLAMALLVSGIAIYVGRRAVVVQ